MYVTDIYSTAVWLSQDPMAEKPYHILKRMEPTLLSKNQSSRAALLKEQMYLLSLQQNR